jgi:hypothetical protein
MNVERLVEWELAGETKVLGENPPQYHSVHHKSHTTWSEIEQPILQTPSITILQSASITAFTGLYIDIYICSCSGGPHQHQCRSHALKILICFGELAASYSAKRLALLTQGPSGIPQLQNTNKYRRCALNFATTLSFLLVNYSNAYRIRNWKPS